MGNVWSHHEFPAPIILDNGACWLRMVGTGIPKTTGRPHVPHPFNTGYFNVPMKAEICLEIHLWGRNFLTLCHWRFSCWNQMHTLVLFFTGKKENNAVEKLLPWWSSRVDNSPCNILTDQKFGSDSDLVSREPWRSLRELLGVNDSAQVPSCCNFPSPLTEVDEIFRHASPSRMDRTCHMTDKGLGFFCPWYL